MLSRFGSLPSLQFIDAVLQPVYLVLQAPDILSKGGADKASNMQLIPKNSEKEKNELK